MESHSSLAPRSGIYRRPSETCQLHKFATSPWTFISTIPQIVTQVVLNQMHSFFHIPIHQGLQSSSVAEPIPPGLLQSNSHSRCVATYLCRHALPLTHGQSDFFFSSYRTMTFAIEKLQVRERGRQRDCHRRSFPPMRPRFRTSFSSNAAVPQTNPKERRKRPNL